jgi:hypothetical protein
LPVSRRVSWILAGGECDFAPVCDVRWRVAAVCDVPPVGRLPWPTSGGVTPGPHDDIRAIADNYPVFRVVYTTWITGL